MAREPELFRIQVVAEMTGVRAPTLRAWEKRYGIPEPGRSSGAYRLYSPEDVQQIQRFRDLRARGVAPGAAAEIVRHEGPAPTPVGVVARDEGLDRAVDAIVDATRRLDAEALERAARGAMAMTSASGLVADVVTPALHRIGAMWGSGELGVAHEHLATHVLEGLLRDLHRIVQPQHAPRTIVLACAADELHGVGPLAAGIHLSTWGYRTVLLGIRTPPDALAAAVERLGPAIVGLSVTVPPTSRRAGAALLDAYAKAVGAAPLVLGGQGAQAMLQAAGGAVAGVEVAPVALDALRRRIDALAAGR